MKIYRNRILLEIKSLLSDVVCLVPHALAVFHSLTEAVTVYHSLTEAVIVYHLQTEAVKVPVAADSPNYYSMMLS
jgi:hypothetical protein